MVIIHQPPSTEPFNPFMEFPLLLLSAEMYM